jgi:ABC-type sugar transport system ATPase subunit
MSYLQIDSLSKSYPGVQALKNVSFAVVQGHTHALVGENGAGKSTLIKILSGAEHPDSGDIWLDGGRFRPQTPKSALAAGVSTIYQVFNLLPDRTVMHNVMLGKEPRTPLGLLDLHAMRGRTSAVLARLNAGHLDPDVRVSDLRVGEKQIIEIARALLMESKLVIMDEPTSALNQHEVQALFKVMAALKAEGVTILYVSHRLDEIFELADAVTVLRDGGHISTKPITAVTRDSLVEDMIGRKLSGVFPERSQPGSTEVLRAEHLSAHRHLHDVSFGLRAGEVLAVAGLSGSGKTELGRALYGDLPLSAGRIILHGESYQPSPRRALKRGLIYLPEDRKTEGLLQPLSVRRNISLSVLERIAALGFIDPAQERRIAQEQIDALDIKTPSMEQQVLNLSGGNQQKVALGKCLAVRPQVFILMEPTQGIDVGVKFDLYVFIAQQAAQGHSVLLISSELTEVLGLAHRILVMRDGRIVAELDGKTATQESVLRHALGEETTVTQGATTT